MSNLVERVSRFIDLYSLINPGDRVLVAFSGGPDSVALAETLRRIQKQKGFELLLLHLNHGLRGEEALRDEHFCVNWALERRLPIVVVRRRILRLWEREKGSLEEVARRVRYEVIERVSAETGSNVVALGHNLGDQAETLLMNIIRGCGLDGLKGMQPASGRYIRPLLFVERKEILEFLNEEGIPFIEDSSNFRLTFFRNRVRHLVMPFLEEVFNPDFQKALFRLAENVQRIAEERESKISLPIERRGDLVALPLSALLDLPPALLFDAVRFFIKEVRGDLQEISQEHLKALVRLIKRGRGKMSLPGKFEIFIKEGKIFGSPISLPLLSYPDWERSLEVPGKTFFEDLGLHIESKLVDKGNLDSEIQEKPGCWSAVLDFDSLRFPVCVRNFRSGDRMVYRGKETKVKELFQKMGVVWEWRRSLPFFCDAEKIAWIPGIALDERVKVKENSKRVLFILCKV